MSWSRKLSEPIALDDGRAFATLRDAADFMLRLPEPHLSNMHWQIAAEAMMKADNPRSSVEELQAAERILKAALRAEGVFDLKEVR